MSVASPPRSVAPRPGVPRALIEERPLRYPDVSSPEVMERRGWWLVLLNFLIPGSAQAVAGDRRLGKLGLGATLAMWVIVVVGLIAFVLWRPFVLSVATNPLALLVIEALLVLYGLLWIVLTLDTLRLVRLVKARPASRVGIAILSVALLVVAGGGAAYAARLTDITRNTLGAIFTASGPPVAPSDGYYNILLLGADSGTGRDSMRFDSISVVSVNADTGRVTITGIPRDLEGFPFVKGSPMAALYPGLHTGHSSATCGWSAAINQLNTELEVCRDGAQIYPKAAAQGSTPGVEATKDAAEGLLGITIPYYAFIDMAGFAALVDALGGVDITVTERLPEGGGPQYEGQPVEQWAIGWIEPGAQHMNGDTAQWYARSRKTTSDWDRMKRQRQLQEAILKQFTPANVLSRFQEVAAAGQHLVKTDIPTSMLGYLTDLAIKSKGQAVTTIELTPASQVDQTTPDIAYVHQLIDTALHPPTPTPTPQG